MRTQNRNIVFEGCLRRLSNDGTSAYVIRPGLFPCGAESALGDLTVPQLKSGAVLLKQARQRFVVRVANAASGSNLIYKIFPLRNPVSRLKYRKYAYTEFANMRRAWRRGVHLPLPVAYLEHRRYGFVSATAVISEDLTGWQDLKEIARLPGENALNAASLAIPPLINLHRNGALHADMNWTNILYSPDRKRFKVIDWQYAGFHQPRASWGLEHMASYFIRHSAVEIREQLQQEWVPRLWQASGKNLPMREFSERIAIMLRLRPSMRKRLRNWQPDRAVALSGD